jgi:hypothetical protein
VSAHLTSVETQVRKRRIELWGGMGVSQVWWREQGGGGEVGKQDLRVCGWSQNFFFKKNHIGGEAKVHGNEDPVVSEYMKERLAVHDHRLFRDPSRRDVKRREV